MLICGILLFTAVCLTVVYSLVPRPGLGTRLCCLYCWYVSSCCLLMLVCALLLFTAVCLLLFTAVHLTVVYCWYVCCLLLVRLIVYCWYISKIISNLKTIFTIIYVHNVCGLRHYYMTCEDGVT